MALADRLRQWRRHLRPTLARWTGPTEVVAELFTGDRLHVVVPEIVGDALYRQGHIEPAVTHVLLDWLEPGMVFFDVGAHYGYYSLLAARSVGPGGTVLAFEPARGTHELLCRNLDGVANVRIENLAVGEADGVIALRDYGVRHSAVNTLLESARVPAGERRRLRAETYDVTVRSLDSYAASTGLVPDVVKLDAEGAEQAILRGMEALLRDAAPKIVLETGDYDDMASPPTAASVDLLEGLGYSAFEYTDEGLRPHVPRARYDYGNLFFSRSPR